MAWVHVRVTTSWEFLFKNFQTIYWRFWSNQNSTTGPTWFCVPRLYLRSVHAYLCCVHIGWLVASWTETFRFLSFSGNNSSRLLYLPKTKLFPMLHTGSTRIGKIMLQYFFLLPCCILLPMNCYDTIKVGCYLLILDKYICFKDQHLIVIIGLLLFIFFNSLYIFSWSL